MRRDEALLEDEGKAASSSAQWEGSVTWHGSMVTSAEGEMALRGGKGGGNTSWAGLNLTVSKNEENSHDQFNCYK
jgi:hypothetical protein